MKRVILKKTTYLQKHSRGLVKRITTYLERYVNEVGKASQKRGEPPWKSLPQKTEAKWLLPEEKTGVFYTGGFLGESPSPGSNEPNKQKGWVRRFIKNYAMALEKCPKRRVDGFRFILSLAPEAVADLTAANISTDQAMREIWRTTVELYRARHGWSDPSEDLAWVAGAHHDTDNTHMHILLFPTTKSGKLLRTNNARGPERINDLNELVAMTNIASEIFWRELLPLSLQSPEFRAALKENPEEEPPLPTITSFKAPSGIPGMRPDDEEEEIQTFRLTDNKTDEDRNLEYGEIPILDRARKKVGIVRGRLQLRSTIAVAMKWANKKIKFFSIFKSLATPEECVKVIKELSKEFPEEALDLENLKGVSRYITNRKTKTSLEDLYKSPIKTAPSLLARIAGDSEPEAVSEENILEWSGKLANVFESATNEKDKEEKLVAIHNEYKQATSENKSEQGRTLQYRRIKRALEKIKRLNPSITDIISPALNCINKIIRGSKRLALILEARALEATHSVKLDKDNQPRLRRERREWGLQKTPTGFEFIVKENQGKPWPPHLDPDTVIEPIKDIILKGGIDTQRELEIPRAKRKSTEELSDIEEPIRKTQEELNQESPLELLIRIKGRKSIQRKAQALQSMRDYGVREFRRNRKTRKGSSSSEDDLEIDIK